MQRRISEEILEYIKNLRKVVKTSQSEVADRLGVSLRSYQRFENNETNIYLEQLVKTLKVLDPNFEGYLLDYFKMGRPLSWHLRRQDILSVQNRPVTPRLVTGENDIFLIKTILIGSEKKVKNHLVGYWEWDARKKTYYWCNNMYQIWEISPNKTVSYKQMVKKIHHQDHKLMKSGITCLLHFATPLSASYKLKEKNENYSCINVIARCYLMEKNEIFYGISYIH